MTQLELFPQHRASSSDGWIYVIRDERGWFKIGFSLNPQLRLRKLQTGNPRPLALVSTWPGDAVLERLLHEHFAEHRGEGEWFAPAPEMRVFAAAGGDTCTIPDVVHEAWYRELGMDELADLLWGDEVRARADEIAIELVVDAARQRNWEAVRRCVTLTRLDVADATLARV